MLKKSFFLFFFSLSVLFFSGCQRVTQPIQQAADIVSGTAALEQKKVADKTLALIKCQELCQNEISQGTDLSFGPCLSNEVLPDWVCDVAHNPRQAADNKPANQCSAFGLGKAHHFVEVDENCNLIKLY